MYFLGMHCMTPCSGFIRTQYSYEMATDPRITAVCGAERIGFGRLQKNQKYSQGETNTLLRLLMYDKYRMIMPDKKLQKKFITPTEMKELDTDTPQLRVNDDALSDFMYQVLENIERSEDFVSLTPFDFDTVPLDGDVKLFKVRDDEQYFSRKTYQLPLSIEMQV